MKKTAIYGAACALALLAVNGCSNMFLEKPAARTGGAELPQGFGTVTVSLSRGAARTALPDPVELNTLHLEYWFAKDGGSAEQKNPAGGKFVLEPGTYALTVRGFIEADNPESLAAQGTTDPAFTIRVGVDAGTVSLTLRPVVTGEGTGSLAFGVRYPAGAAVETLVLTRIAGDERFDLLDPQPAVTGTDPLDLSGTKTNVPVGYYLLRVTLRNAAGLATGKSEVVHVYQNLTATTALAGYTFTDDDFRAYLVSSANDTGQGSLRQALIDAPDGATIRTALEPGAVIALQSVLPTISNSIIIEGNGVTLTRAASWNNNNSPLLSTNSTAEVLIRRVCFKDSVTTDGVEAILSEGTLTLESCVFSGNQITTNINAPSAIYSSNTLTIRGCTFYGNTAYDREVVDFQGSGKTLTLTGNLFYGNSAGLRPLVYNYQGTVNASYNVVDTAFGTGAGQIGWAQGTGDLRTAAAPPVSGTTFKLLSGSGAAGALSGLPPEYPAADFYGNPIHNGGAAGAVQVVAEGSGYYLEVAVNNGAAGTATTATEPDRDGLYPPGSALTAAANPGYAFGYWLVNGVKTTGSPLVSSGHARIQAVFNRAVRVESVADAGPGTLRQALTNAEDGDVISFGEVTPGITAVRLESALPMISNSITIEGNGVTLTRAASWTTSPVYGGLLYISNANAEVQISRVHFKGGNVSNVGGAILSVGTLVLESCIFSGNQAEGGGAIDSSNTLTIRGCTFYGNAVSYTGTLYFRADGKTLTLTGNLFYGNTAATYPVVFTTSGAVVNASYNVVDRPFGTNTAQCGWAQGTGDTLATELPISPATFRLLPGRGAAGALTTLPDAYPDTDFYGSPVSSGGAAGAVQGAGTGYYLDLSANNDAAGTLAIAPVPDPDGFVSGAFTLTATPNGGYTLGYWLVNGVETPAAPTSLSAHTVIQAVFNRTEAVTVNIFTDGLGSATTPGTLRYALTNALEGDRITFTGVIAGNTTVELESALPPITKKGITIEGKGVTLTRDASWATSPTTGGLLSISNADAEVKISGIHFKDGRATAGGAIFSSGTLTLESCIFSGNQASAGVLLGTNTLSIRGCTFYGNTSNNEAVYFSAVGKTLTMTGNLFYGNTSSQYPVVRIYDGTVTASYNVVDAAYGTGTDQAGWAAGTGDTTFALLGITGDPFDTTTFVPVAELGSVLPSSPADFPTTDFNGAPRTYGAPGAVNKE